MIDWNSSIQTVVAVIGFAAVIYQLRQVDSSVRSASRGSIYDLAARVKQNLIDNPELKPYFHDAKAISEEDSNYNRVMAIADLFCLYLETIATQCEGTSKGNQKAWRDYVRTVYETCPAIRINLKGKEDWYSQEFWDIVEPKS